ncbi:hypothetical protein GQ43DRAFT_441826 [Delitschia confertaspora ATCC 74209]|uniref:Transcriptional regulatory protein DEP1 n=1 Tax=Delitschia confertaspora ATCC 74209 TaxID=1513339 RepID=A0A9P4JIS0_9PLEO|nr:hypothetical protein GQ43DRAFT_441826 [Delitschia confertaspora ATCC 74209]
MSVLQTRRSRSTTAPETGPDAAASNGAIPTSNNDRPPPSTGLSSSRLAASAAVTAPLHTQPLEPHTTALAVMPTAQLPALPSEMAENMDADKDGYEDYADNRSSSLSELDEPTPRPHAPEGFAENDSEAETERLENTPRRLARTATDLSVVSDHTFERTPSKLAHANTHYQDESGPPSPLATLVATMVDATGADAGLDTLSLVAAAEAGSIAELAGKKRKRSSAESISVHEPFEEPARKRSGTAKSATTNGSEEVLTDSAEQVNLVEEPEPVTAEDRISELAHEHIALENRQADIAQETVTELAAVARIAKPKRGGGRRGKRKVDDAGDTNSEILAHALEADVEADNDEDDAHDEESSKKKAAIESLMPIEKKFKLWREKLCDEQIAQCERELEILKQPNCTHPEFLSMVQCIDERRAEKIAFEKTLRAYKEKTLDIRINAEYHQAHSQYIQTVRKERERILSDCNQRVFELQRGRRQLGVEEINYSLKFPEKRSEQVRQQAAYNLEVSILAGTAKYVGFPAAPEMPAARPSDIDDDLRAMKITTRQPPPVPYVRQYTRTSAADEAAAEEQFIERTPWANPHHPAHHQAHYPGVAPGPPRASGQIYHTPAGQRRIVDVHAPNGSASTIDMLSNPPSSAAAQGPSHVDITRQESESPVLHMKRRPDEHRIHNETPLSQPRNFGMLSRETYPNSHPLGSSPAVNHMEQPLHDREGHAGPLGSRWGANGVRNHTTGPSIPAGSVIPGRPDVNRVPLPQRSTLGAVSVGNGNGIYGR